MNEASVGFQCPECVSEGRKTVRRGKTQFGGSAAGQAGIVTKVMIGLNLALLVVSAASASGGNALFGGNWGGLLGGITPLIEWGAVNGALVDQVGNIYPYGIADGEYYRLFTAMFLHYGLLHAGLNSWVLWVIGRDLEAALGPLRYIALYLICGVGGNVAAYVFQPAALTAGASTVAFGFFAALFVLLRRLGRDASALLPVLVVNILFTFAVPGISIAGHLGGLVVGGLAAAALAYAPRERRALFQGLGLGALVVLLAVVTAVQTAALTG
jgi:membrane associated rhomboid family serine protease